MAIWGKSNHKMYFFHKNTPVHKNINRIMLGITAVTIIVTLLFYFLCHTIRVESFSIFFGAMIAIFTSYLVTWFYYYTVTFQKNKEQDEIALQALCMLHIVYKKIMFIVNELKKAQCSKNIDDIIIPSLNSPCEQKCELNGKNKCLLNYLIFTRYDGIVTDIEQGMQICIAAKPSAFLFFRDALSRLYIVKRHTEVFGSVTIRHICSINTAYLFLTKGKSGAFDMPDTSHFPKYADDHELVARLLSNHFSKMPTLTAHLQNEGVQNSSMG